MMCINIYLISIKILRLINAYFKLQVVLDLFQIILSVLSSNNHDHYTLIITLSKRQYF